MKKYLQPIAPVYVNKNETGFEIGSSSTFNETPWLHSCVLLWFLLNNFSRKRKALPYLILLPSLQWSALIQFCTFLHIWNTRKINKHCKFQSREKVLIAILMQEWIHELRKKKELKYNFKIKITFSLRKLFFNI